MHKTEELKKIDNNLKDIRYTLKTVDPKKIQVVKIICTGDKEYSDTVEAIAEGLDLKNVVYVHRQVDLATGKPEDSNIKFYEKQ